MLDLSEIVGVFRHVENEGVQDVFIWLHSNLSRAGYLRWLQSHLELPEPSIELLDEETHSTRTGQQNGVLVVVFSDVILDLKRTPTQMATQWIYAHRRLLMTLHHKPLHSVGRLCECVRSGETLRPPADLLNHLTYNQADLTAQIIHTTGIDIDHIRDRFLASRITSERQELMGTHHVLVRFQRALVPEPGSVFRLLVRPPIWLHPEDVQQLRESTGEFSVALRDMSGLVKHIKLLQEEVIARLDEQSNRTLFTLTLVTVLALPVNIVAGPFGMNVGDVSLADNHYDSWLMVGLVMAFTVIATWWVARHRNSHQGHLRVCGDGRLGFGRLSHPSRLL